MNSQEAYKIAMEIQKLNNERRLKVAEKQRIEHEQFVLDKSLIELNNCYKDIKNAANRGELETECYGIIHKQTNNSNERLHSTAIQILKKDGYSISDKHKTRNVCIKWLSEDECDEYENANYVISKVSWSKKWWSQY